jgi:hypothetical protein
MARTVPIRMDAAPPNSYGSRTTAQMVPLGSFSDGFPAAFQLSMSRAGMGAPASAQRPQCCAVGGGVEPSGIRFGCQGFHDGADLREAASGRFERLGGLD